MSRVVAGFIVVLLVCTPAIAQRATAPAQASMRPVASVADLMHGLVIPASDVVFTAASTPPTKAADWENVRVQALLVAESANLLMMAGRGPDRTQWNQMANAQFEAALVAVDAAKKKDVKALETASDSLYGTCDNCHSKYMKK
jgi:hypothetical protein